MKAHEFQSKALLKEYDIPTQQQIVAVNPEQAVRAAEKFNNDVVVKAQVLSGGRGKAGGVKLAKSAAEVQTHATNILKIRVQDMPVEKLLIVPRANIKREFYFALTLDRNTKKVIFIASAEGGVEIEILAQKNPDAITYMPIDPLSGIVDEELDQLISSLALQDHLVKQAKQIFNRLYLLFLEKDCSLVEINPLAEIEEDGDTKLVALDAKVTFDDNAIFKHPEIERLRNVEEYHPDEIYAKEHGLSFVNMDGTIGCVVNGAGLAMATMDLIKYFGGEPANFLDVGGSSNPEKVFHALKIITNNPKVKSILINIFGGITRCDDIAKGFIIATERLSISIPIVIRLVGTNQELGREMLMAKGYTAESKLNDAVKKAVAL